MGRIITPLKITSVADSSFLTLPSAWKQKLGQIEVSETVELELANQSCMTGKICGPVKIQIEGFRPVYNEVLFVDMEPEDGIYEPILGLYNTGTMSSRCGHVRTSPCPYQKNGFKITHLFSHQPLNGLTLYAILYSQWS